MKKKGKGKVGRVMGEFKRGELHSGSKHGPVVTNPKQAVAIGMSEARKAGEEMPKKHESMKDRFKRKMSRGRY